MSRKAKEKEWVLMQLRCEMGLASQSQDRGAAPGLEGYNSSRKQTRSYRRLPFAQLKPVLPLLGPVIDRYFPHTRKLCTQYQRVSPALQRKGLQASVTKGLPSPVFIRGISLNAELSRLVPWKHFLTGITEQTISQFLGLLSSLFSRLCFMPDHALDHIGTVC